MSSGQVYEPCERHHNDELRVPSNEYAPNKPFVKKEENYSFGLFYCIVYLMVPF